MNKKTERIAIIGLAAFLVGYFAYQAAYGTNESDYKYGYKDGLGEYHHCYINHICAVSEDIYTAACEPGGLNLGSTPVYHVDNETACQHGYNHGWIKECFNDGGGAWCREWHNGGPVIAAITGPGRCYNNTGGQTCESGNFIPV